MVKSWDITIDEFIHVLQIMKEESGGNTIIGTATDVTDELKFFDTKVKGLDGMWKHKKAIQYDTKLISSEMVMKEEEDYDGWTSNNRRNVYSHIHGCGSIYPDGHIEYNDGHIKKKEE